jgi:hypothetical protein
MQTALIGAGAQHRLFQRHANTTLPGPSSIEEEGSSAFDLPRQDDPMGAAAPTRLRSAYRA